MWEKQGNLRFLKSLIIINNVMSTRNSLRNVRCLQDASIMVEKSRQHVCPSRGFTHLSPTYWTSGSLLFISILHASVKDVILKIILALEVWLS